MPAREAVIRKAQHGDALTTFLRRRRSLRTTLAMDLAEPERRQVVEAFTALLEGLYAHLPLKRAMYAIDPLQRLRLLGQRVDRLSALDFHFELASIITSLRDAHTRYVGPTELDGCVAMLPFLVEAYGPPDAPRYIVSKVAADRTLIGNSRYFRPGVEIRWWNAVPMDLAVDRHADSETGGRPDARRARALESMTLRSLQYGPPPDEQWVVIGYVDRHGHERELSIEWRVVRPRRAATSGQSADAQGRRRVAIDPAAETHRRVKKLLFAPELWYADRRVAQVPADVQARGGEWLPTTMQDALAAKEIRVKGRRLGYLRLWSFDVADDQAYLAEVVRLLGLLPDRGLIIDLRSNPGGSIVAAERLFQLFTPNPVTPNRFSLLATPMTRAMAGLPQNANELAPWQASLTEAVATGEPYSLAVPITPAAACNDVGQVYGGPVVAIVDANTYSAGDLFAAGFVDNGLGPLVSVGEATGAGGANVWRSEDVDDALQGWPSAPPPLPGGVSYTLAVRRATRAGPSDGAAIEDVGVQGDPRYAMTLRDLTGSNEDLLDFAGTWVLGLPRTALSYDLPAADGDPLVVRLRGVDRLDVAVDGSNQASRPVRSGSVRVELPSGWTEVELRAKAAGRVVQRRVLSRD
jgi:Peptidase family S41